MTYNASAVVSETNALPVAPSADQDPIYDHTNSKVTSVTSTATILTPPAGAKFAEIVAPSDIWVRTDGVAAAVPAGGDTNAAIYVPANTPRIVPVTVGVAVKAISASGSAVVVTAVPLKARI